MGDHRSKHHVSGNGAMMHTPSTAAAITGNDVARIDDTAVQWLCDYDERFVRQGARGDEETECEAEALRVKPSLKVKQ
ncbi:restriction endonuclease [Sesbania bispinosa]|nr:restriction endonuclease [Sesbania bispinosa]